jgi:hypothetical protein
MLPPREGTVHSGLSAEPRGADAPWAEGASVNADLLERAGDRLDVGVGVGEVKLLLL